MDKKDQTAAASCLKENGERTEYIPQDSVLHSTAEDCAGVQNAPQPDLPEDKPSEPVSESRNADSERIREKTTKIAPDLPPPKTPELDVQKPVCVFCNGLTGFGITQQGQSHIRNGNVPCQDSVEIRLLQAAPIILAAVADGVGECANSHYGSRTAVHAALDVLQNRLEALAGQAQFVFRNHGQMQQLMVEAFRVALKAVEDQAVLMEKAPDSFQSTLTVAVYDGAQLYIGHAGDDGLVALDTSGECKMLTRRHKGEASNSVYPLQARNMDFVAVDQEIAAFALMTDGVLDAVVGNEVFGNRVYYPFFRQLFEPELQHEQEVQALCRSADEMLAGKEYRERVSDDISLVVVVNQSLMKHCKKPHFDPESWNRQTEQITKQIEKQLYSKKQPLNTAGNAKPSPAVMPKPAQPPQKNPNLPPRQQAKSVPKPYPQNFRRPEKSIWDHFDALDDFFFFSQLFPPVGTDTRKKEPNTVWPPKESKRDRIFSLLFGFDEKEDK